MGRSTTKIIGLLLVAIGAVSIMEHTFHIQLFSMQRMWPIFVLIPGLCFEFSYFSTKKAPGVLVPGGILITLGCLFFFEANTNFIFAHYTWPVYVLAPAVGLLQLYLFGTHEKRLLIPITILTTVAVVSFCIILLSGMFGFINRSLIWPVVFIVLGLLLLFGRSQDLSDEYDRKKL